MKALASISVEEPGSAHTDMTVAAADTYRLSLALSPRPHNARAGYPSHWGRGRFERLGDVWLIPPGHSARVLADDGKHLSLFIEMRPSLIDQWLPKPVAWDSHILERSIDVPCGRVRVSLARLAEEMYLPGTGSPELLTLVIRQVGVEIARYLQEGTGLSARGGLSLWQLRAIEERVGDLGSPPTLADLSAICRLSTRQLSRSFRMSRRLTIKEFVVQSRLNQARRELDGDASIERISASVGLKSASHFADVFRKQTGFTPRLFRQLFSVIQARDAPGRVELFED